MNHDHIVPPKPKEVRLLRHKKAWLFGWITFGLALLTLAFIGARIASGDAIADWLVIACAATTVLSGIVSLVFRFTEQPREISVPRFPTDGPVIHFRS